MDPVSWAGAGAIATLVALLGLAARALTPSGVVAATVVGTVILAGQGWIGGAALGTFFGGSSWVSHYAARRGAPAGDAKGNQRDAWQVLANGGAAVLGALLTLGGAGPLGLWMTIGALAAAAADTWATSIGGLTRGATISLRTRRPVAPGTSGGVSLLGTLGGLIGALSVVVVLVAWAPAWPAARGDGWGTRLAGPGSTVEIWPLAVAALVGGLLGMLADSWLGATVQGRFHCPHCDATTERRYHGCGARAVSTGGWPWLTNDGVNALATSFAALFSGWAWWCWPS